MCRVGFLVTIVFLGNSPPWGLVCVFFFVRFVPFSFRPLVGGSGGVVTSYGSVSFMFLLS